MARSTSPAYRCRALERRGNGGTPLPAAQRSARLSAVPLGFALDHFVNNGSNDVATATLTTQRCSPASELTRPARHTAHVRAYLLSVDEDSTGLTPEPL